MDKASPALGKFAAPGGVSKISIQNESQLIYERKDNHEKIVSLILVLVLALGLTVSASAATVVNDTTHAYEAYQIFSGTQTGTEANLGKIVWGSGVDGAALLADLQLMPDFASATSAEAVAAILADPATPVDTIRQFAQLAYNNKSATAIDIPAGATEVSLLAGYYLIVDTTTPVDGDALNPALLQVTNAGPIHIQKKYDVPESDKYVVANDDGDHSEHSKDEDSPIGKPVDFHLKAEMPLNMEGYEKYKMVFHDDLSDGLTFDPASVQVFVGDTVTPIATSYYTLVPSVVDCDKDGGGYTCDFHVVIENVMTVPGYAPGCDVIVKYTATLNEDALIDEANPNDFRLEYANNPNWDPDDPSTPNQPTGVTPWKEVEVWTTQVEIRKVDGTTDQPLQGAEFTLEGVGQQKIKITKNEFAMYAPSETVDPANKYWLLKDGSYTTQDPSLPEMDATLYASLTDLYKNTGVTVTWEENTLSDTKTVAEVGPDGTVKFGGLGEGVYTITETKTPDGYNGLKEPMTLTVVFHEAEERFEYSWTGGAIGSGASITVDNMKGSVLPETGGIGTTLFYVIGGLLVAAAAVLLVTKKRMTAE